MGLFGGDENVDNVEIDKDTLRSKSTLKVLDVVSEGPIGGPVDGLKSVFINNAPIITKGNNRNYDGIKVDWRLGNATQSYIAGFSAITSEYDLGNQEIQFNDPVIFSINSEADAVKITVNFPRLYWAQKDGDVRKLSVPFSISYKDSTGKSFTAIQPTVTGKTSSSYDVSWRIDLTGAAPWDVTISRSVTDEEQVYAASGGKNGTKYWKSYAKSYTVIVDHKLSYPNTAVFGMEVDAEVSGLTSVSSRQYVVYGLIIEVPTNYDPVSRTYAGSWDGTFKLAWTNNPAWIYRDIIVKKRYGLGRFVDPLIVDKWELYTIARYCDELVPDGYNGSEPRFTCNLALSNEQSAYETLTALASIFRGFPLWSSGSVVARADMPRDPVGLVSPVNVIDGFIGIESSARNARYTAAAVTFLRAERDWEQDVEIYEDPDAIQKYGYRLKSVSAFATTSRGQAQRIARWLVYTDCYEVTVATWKAAWDHLFYSPGDIVLVSDQYQSGVRLSGRIKSVDAQQLTLDAPIDTRLPSTISCMGINGDIETRTITTGSSSTANIFIGSPFSNHVSSNTVFVITQTANVQPRMFRILSVAEDEDNDFVSVQALSHDPEKFAKVENGLSFDDDTIYSDIHIQTELDTPTNLTITEVAFLKDNRLVNSIDLSWTASNDRKATVYRVEQLGPEEPTWKLVSNSTSLSIRLFNPDAGNYQFRVRAEGIFASKPSDWLTSEQVIIYGGDRTPADVSGFTADIQSEQVMLYWFQPTIEERKFISYYQIRHSPNVAAPVKWEQATILKDRIPADTVSFTTTGVTGMFLIKAFSLLGKGSINAAIAVVGVNFLPHVNTVQVYNEDMPWPGFKDKVEVYSNSLRLKSNPATGQFYTRGHYYFDTVYDLGYGCGTARIESLITATGVNPQNKIGAWYSLKSVARIGDQVGDNWRVAMEVAISYDNVLWTKYERVIRSDYIFRYAKFRLVLETQSPIDTTPAVLSWDIFITMPDRVARGTGVTSSGSAAVTVNMLPGFHVKPAIQVAPESSQYGYVIASPDQDSFDVTLFNTAGVQSAANFSWFASGYGNRTTCPLRFDIGVPTLIDDMATVGYNKQATLFPFANDFHVAPGAQVVIIKQPIHGSATVTDKGIIQYIAPLRDDIYTKLPLRSNSGFYAPIASVIGHTPVVQPYNIPDLFDEIVYSVAGYETQVSAVIQIAIPGV